jgi:hypothetical protein
MNAQQRIEKTVLRQINRVGGELLTLLPRNVSVWASVDRINSSPNKVSSDITVQGEVGVTIYIQKRLLNDPPEEGEFVQEANGTQHTIGEVKDLGFRWQLSCLSTPG